MEKERKHLDEEDIVNRVRVFLINKERGNWHEDKTKVSKLHGHGADIILVGGNRNSERFIIECKGKSYAQSESAAKAINAEGWLNALGQIITRMTTSRVIKSGARKGDINQAYKYGLGLYWKSARIALKRISKEIATTLNLYIFSINEEGEVKQFTPSKFGKLYNENEFR